MNLLQKRREKEREILLRNIKIKSEKGGNFKMIVQIFDGIDSENPTEIILIDGGVKNWNYIISYMKMEWH